MSVLILDGHECSALCAVRSLGMRGIKCAVAADNERTMSFYSKYCSHRFIYPSCKEELPRFLERIFRIVESNEFKTIFCFSDATFLSVFRARHQLPSSLQFPVASEEAIELSYSKEATLKFAEKLGIPIPTTYFADDIDDVREISKEIRYPLVLKAKHSCRWVDGRVVPRDVTYIHSEEELVRECEKELVTNGKLPLIQEFVPGDGYGICALFNEGKLRAYFAYRKVRYFSPVGGRSVLTESIEASPETALWKYGIELFKALNWHGVGMVEFKGNPDNGSLRLMEINGRFWGSLALPVASGVDFPYLSYKMAVDGDVQPILNYRVGVKRRHLLGDIHNLFKVMAGREKYPYVDYPSRINTLLDFLKFYGKDLHYDILRMDDALPFGIELSNEVQRVLRRNNTR